MGRARTGLALEEAVEGPMGRACLSTGLFSSSRHAEASLHLCCVVVVVVV